MAYIPPVSLPSAAGVDFGEGDVRHFSQGDSFTVPGLSNPTRHLAARDNTIVSKLNDVITEINNKEQIVPLPVYRLVIPPNSDEIVANHRIPGGYEARVLNAAISASPTSADIELNVMWSLGFGNVSGTTVLTTTSESSGGTVFSPSGEFIIQVKNKGNVTLDIVASIMLTMRPVTDIAGALLPTAIIVPPGPTGRQGDQGGKGDTGSTGPAGSPGLNFRRAWARLPFPVTYLPNDVVSHDFAGTSRTSSYVCIQSHTASGINEPQPSLTPSPFWEYMAEAGAAGSSGSTGGTNAIDFSLNPLTANFTAGSGFVSGSSNGGYTGGTFAVGYRETVILQEDGHGLAHLDASIRRIFAGDATINLPTSGAGVTWNNDNAKLIISSTGTLPVSVFASAGSYASAATSYTSGTAAWVVNVPGTTPQKVEILVVGSEVF